MTRRRYQRGSIYKRGKRNKVWVGREVEVLVKGATDEAGFVQGHTRGNHVTIIKGNLAPGLHRARVVHATPNRLYCAAPETESYEPALARRELKIISLPLA